ncbi:MAG: hypothetical protein DMD85_09960 [Candidatus Rokuibacteriota bacterium]|nr:MAG: hypothetical protein DMD85_09960 [Candidatus Rokubacteria bacterium]
MSRSTPVRTSCDACASSCATASVSRCSIASPSSATRSKKIARSRGCSAVSSGASSRRNGTARWSTTFATRAQLEYGVRRSVTNLDLVFHTDAAWLDLPPELVGLYCINPAREGGVSRFVSLVTVHNELVRRHAPVLPRLYRAFPWDRQAEHAPGDVKVAWRPIFSYDGRGFMACVNDKLIETGAELAGEALDDEARASLTATRALLDAPELRVEFTIERGQVQFINNRQFAHSRTDFTDAPEPHLKRHMIRLWTREEGRRTFHG